MYTISLQEMSNMAYYRVCPYINVASRAHCELGHKYDACCREVSTIECPLHRGFIMRV